MDALLLRISWACCEERLAGWLWACAGEGGRREGGREGGAKGKGWGEVVARGEEALTCVW